MVSLWPWRKDDTSPASFEKALSVLSDNISKSQVKLDSLRQNSRRLGLLWLLYSVFAYILCAAIFALVYGWRNWGAIEYTAVAGGPLVIYLVKAGITGYYTYRIDTVSARLEGYQAERAKTIEKLKAATKYNSTQQLLEKYGGVAPSPTSSPAGNRKSKAPGKSPGPRGSHPVQRTGLGPPPTANIPRNSHAPPPSPPEVPAAGPTQGIPPPSIPLAEPKAPVDQAGAAEFAPNAFSRPTHAPSSSMIQGGNWYDRILDAILGEDETMAKNRLALICENCKTILGQAPPGVKRLEDIGKWKCGACGAWNGVEDEGKKIVKQMQQQAKMEVHDDSLQSAEKDDPIGLSSGGDGDDEMQTEDYEFEDDDEEDEVGDEVEEIPAAVATKAKKAKAKTSKKK